MESGWSEDVCLPFGHFVLATHLQVFKVLVSRTNDPQFL